MEIEIKENFILVQNPLEIHRFPSHIMHIFHEFFYFLYLRVRVAVSKQETKNASHLFGGSLQTAQQLSLGQAEARGQEPGARSPELNPGLGGRNPAT